MNIFYLDHDPIVAAKQLPDKHIVKMPVEAVQMLVSVLQRHDVLHEVNTKKGTRHKGGYRHHPCTKWAGDSRANFLWLWTWGIALCKEYTFRYEKHHFAERQLLTILQYAHDIPEGDLSEAPQAMPEECKVEGDVVLAYRNCINHKLRERPGVFTWKKTRTAPEWAVT